MIYDKISNWKKYLTGNGVFKVEKFISGDIGSLTDGLHEIDGELMFAYVSSYDTKLEEEAIVESHNRYADVHVMINGEERLDCFKDASVDVETPYDENNDVAIYNRTGEEADASICLKPGQFVLFFPDDIHSPQIACGSPEKVKKIVVKIDCELLE